MSYTIDVRSYDKAARWPTLTTLPNGRRMGRGYEARQARQVLRGIILHSSEDRPGQTFAGLCGYLRDSATVSTHYVISRAGGIVRTLDPGPYLAYHAGVSRGAFGPACNLYTVGIELMHTRGGPDYTAAQLGALAWLCRVLMADHPTIARAGIQLHRAVALPAGRKADPTDRSDQWWAAWIAAL